MDYGLGMVEEKFAGLRNSRPEQSIHIVSFGYELAELLWGQTKEAALLRGVGPHDNRAARNIGVGKSAQEAQGHCGGSRGGPRPSAFGSDSLAGGT